MNDPDDDASQAGRIRPNDRAADADEAMVGSHGTPPSPGDVDLQKLFEVWMDDASKLMITVFFQHNPGVIETVEGLARRLGTTPEAIREAISDHVAIGLLTEKTFKDKVVLVYNRKGRADMEDFIAEQIRKRMEEE